jgi:threonine synthase
MMGKGIWQFADRMNPLVEGGFRLNLGEGETRLQEIEGLYFKREDENPTGSVKDRGMAFQISAWMKNRAILPFNKCGLNKVVISSSGNAAISAAAYCKLAGIDLNVFVSKKIGIAKLERLLEGGNLEVHRFTNLLNERTRKSKISIVQTDRPVSAAHRYAQKHGLYNLRPSKDRLASIGYQTIAYELQRQLSDIGSIWFPVSSGTTMIGTANGYKSSIDENDISKMFTMDQKLLLPQIHAVQTSKVHSIAKYFDSDFSLSKSSLASALVAKVVHQKNEIIALIDKSEGSGWVVNDKQILLADKWLRSHKIKTSYEGATALAGYFKAKKAGFRIRKPVVIVLTGSL